MNRGQHLGHGRSIERLVEMVAEDGHAYGGFGVSLALIAAIGIISSFWIWIAAASKTATP